MPYHANANGDGGDGFKMTVSKRQFRNVAGCALNKQPRVPFPRRGTVLPYVSSRIVDCTLRYLFILEAVKPCEET